nr:N-acetylmuramoyl-L-alanine amidase [Spirosoma utsteinense]
MLSQSKQQARVSAKKKAQARSRVVRRRPVVRRQAIGRKPVSRRAKAAPKRTVVRKSRTSPRLPLGSGRAMVRNEPLLGSRYARVAVLDKQLSGAVFYLASGHGGPDPGAIGRFGVHRLPEDEYAYDVTVRLARTLLQHGATVYMIVQDRNDGIRDGAVLPIDYDEVAYPKQAIPRNQTARLRQTTNAVNQLFARNKGRYQRFITIHVDSRSKGETIDVFFYHHPASAAGQRLARHIHRGFLANYRRHRPSRPYLGRVSSRGSLFVIRNSQAPTVFIELGNIQNKMDQRRFLLAQNRQALATWLCQGMVADHKRQ